jgi:uncharacterized membrane protein
MNWYGILKVVHVLSAIVWMGGGVALTVVLFRILGTRDRGTLAQFVPQVARYMASVGGPASGLLLVSGIAMVLVMKLSFKALWISLGFGGIILLGAYGGLVMSKRIVALEQAAQAGDDATLAGAAAKVRQSSIILISIMAAVVAVMVLKPTL